MSTDDPDTDTDAADLEEAFPHVAKLEQELKEADIDIGDIDVAEILQQGGTTRRDLLAGGAGALGLGGLLTAASGTASAGNDQAGTVGSQAAPLDGYVEDLYDKNGNRVAELPGDGSLDVLQELSSQSVNAGKVDTERTWQDVTSSRALDSIETNSSGSEIAAFVAVDVNADGTTVGLGAFLPELGQNIDVVERTFDSGDRAAVQFLSIPNGENYFASTFSGVSNISLRSWIEYRP